MYLSLVHTSIETYICTVYLVDLKCPASIVVNMLQFSKGFEGGGVGQLPYELIQVGSET